MDLAGYREFLDPGEDLLIKLNLSWTKYLPSCSSQPWQLEGVVKKLLADCFQAPRVHPLENKTVVTEPWKGAKNNRWMKVLQAYGLDFNELPDM